MQFPDRKLLSNMSNKPSKILGSCQLVGLKDKFKNKTLYDICEKEFAGNSIKVIKKTIRNRKEIDWREIKLLLKGELKYLNVCTNNKKSSDNGFSEWMYFNSYFNFLFTSSSVSS